MTLEAREAARIVVLGGGAGGLELAIKLARLTRTARRARVTLVDKRPTHIWKPRLHEIGAGLLVAAEEETGYSAQALRHGFDFILGEAIQLDPLRREVHIASETFPPDAYPGEPTGELMLPARTLRYHTAVLALGSTINDFGVPGVAEHCHTLDTPDHAERLHRALLASATRVKAGLQPKLRVAIVGAGTSGVELAAELRDAARRLLQYRSLLTPQQLDIVLLEKADRPLPSSPAALSEYARAMLAEHRVEMRFGAEVVRMEQAGIDLKNGSHVDADVMVWVSGVKARQLAHAIEGLGDGPNGRLAVDESLRVLGENGAVVEGLYGLGDCVAAPSAGGGVVGATAQAAHQQAGLLARSIARQLRGRSALPFRFRYKGTLVSLGAGAAVGDVPTPTGGEDWRVSGPGAKLAYAGLYEAHRLELHGVWRTAALAASAALRRSTQPHVKLSW